MTAAQSLHPIDFNEKIAEERQARIDLSACFRPVAAYTLDGLFARAVAAGIAVSKQGMGGAPCPALRKLDNEHASYLA